jgi:hypothetical protein
MSLPSTAIAAYAVTLVVALASAVAHPWYDAESRFLKALTTLNADTAAVLVSADSP